MYDSIKRKSRSDLANEKKLKFVYKITKFFCFLFYLLIIKDEVLNQDVEEPVEMTIVVNIQKVMKMMMMMMMKIVIITIVMMIIKRIIAMIQQTVKN
jgi:hypothetical protein